MKLPAINFSRSSVLARQGADKEVGANVWCGEEVKFGRDSLGGLRIGHP
jgi:hypothetical protein